VFALGDHAEIEKWRREQAALRTQAQPADLWKKKDGMKREFMNQALLDKN